MPRYTLYVYAEGNDLHDVAADIEARVEQFIHDHRWRHAMPTVVNQRRPDDPTLGPGDLPDRDLGLNPRREPEGCFNDVERIGMFFAELRSATGRDFVIGIGDNERAFSEDLLSIDGPSPDLRLLRRMIGGGRS